MKNWEYITILIDMNEAADPTAKQSQQMMMNDLGNEGWEIASSTSCEANGFQYEKIWLKKPIQE